jgi:hypothetical protein
MRHDEPVPGVQTQAIFEKRLDRLLSLLAQPLLGEHGLAGHDAQHGEVVGAGHDIEHVFLQTQYTP